MMTLLSLVLSSLTEGMPIVELIRIVPAEIVAREEAISSLLLLSTSPPAAPHQTTRLGRASSSASSGAAQSGGEEKTTKKKKRKRRGGGHFRLQPLEREAAALELVLTGFSTEIFTEFMKYYN